MSDNMDVEVEVARVSDLLFNGEVPIIKKLTEALCRTMRGESALEWKRHLLQYEHAASDRKVVDLFHQDAKRLFSILIEPPALVQSSDLGGEEITPITSG